MRPGPIGEVYIAIIVREVLKGIEYLHGERKLHRDIKGMASFMCGLIGCRGRAAARHWLNCESRDMDSAFGRYHAECGPVFSNEFRAFLVFVTSAFFILVGSGQHSAVAEGGREAR
jgi:hypothetical protein